MFTWFLGERCAINKEPMLYGYKKKILKRTWMFHQVISFIL